jgi:hypothetical protein
MPSITKQFTLRPAPNAEFIGASDDIATLTVRNLGPGIVYYSYTTPLVTPTVNSGSITSGATATLTPGAYLISDVATTAVVLVTYNAATTTASRPLPSGFAYGGGEVVATRPGLAASSAFSSGATNFISNLQSAHNMIRDATTICLYYRNGHHETDNANTLTLRAQVSLGASGAAPFIPVYFNGFRQITLDAGGAILSDPVPVDLLAGTQFFVHTMQTAGTQQAGEKYIINHNTFLTGEFGNNTASDQTGVQLASGAIGGLMPTYITAGSGAPTRRALMGIYGDSIPDGKHDTNQEGYVARALKGNYGYVSACLSSEQLSTFVTAANSFRRRLLMDGITAAITNYGINDCSGGRTLPQMQADVALLTAIMRRAGATAVTWCTLCPNTTSSDAWATTGNQTVSAFEAARVAFNDWLRTHPAGVGIDYVFDAADVVEANAAGAATRNGGRWGVTYASAPGGGGGSPDGIHPTIAGHLALKTALQAFIVANPGMLGIS